ncbi:hypothetical protein A3H89_04565 [Candidatus Amesbacteria bacterium RIFCSPLOWO2_02_FULL_48_11]|uniref:Aminoglycoside phosphotransferase domain-containing protein n=5 Tax=Candidatus Amesiibacteriota TaxID=1752730 RepID=A0A1F4Z7L6_9BACT|nr:MAG: hypothetical protein UX78_C0008G0004 [Candidatus Amesbacteria bacterium GW2011_GWA2_47_11]KKU94709.1 MAG: hypothetical protein UY22_C0008G0006 [Candidatus Amesbacteria bacterium GW2011_GWC1_48_10]KKW00896.1 MAG: hypothetical protein UY33_C0003G0024 [Candidatus Amesbacteria bacterium GW2011_GWA1_48_9]OGC90042.1 MAG: hypothetical protein A2V48_01380 [Candidatus Amesbacteria bacterium RBG_19FT_COMBO_48_16]OGC97267.1 MAG: hypothetical protein A3C34_04480 [Candidatus Amesbacteria bacterium R
MSFIKTERELDATELLPIATFVHSNWHDVRAIRVLDYTPKGYFNYGVYKIIDGKGNTYAFKRHGEASIKTMEFVKEVFAHLKTMGFKNYSGFIDSSIGDPYVIDPDSVPCSLSPWISGASIHGTDLPKEDLIRVAARTLAIFHLSTSNFQINQHTILDYKMSELWVPELVERYKMALGELNGKVNVFRKLNVQVPMAQLLEKVEPLIEFLSNTRTLDLMEERLARGIIHDDLDPTHLLFTHSGECYLIDFDRQRYGRRIDDLEQLISNMIPINRKAHEIILEEYTRVVPLSGYEQRTLPFFVQYGTLRRTFWLINELINNQASFSERPINVKAKLKTAIAVFDKARYPASHVDL